MKNYWPTKKLGEVCEIIAGQAPSSQFYNKERKGKPFLRVNSFGEIYPQIDAWTTKCLKESKEGDVLFSVAGSLGFVNLGINACITRSIFALRPKKNLIDQKFLFHFLKLKGQEFGKSGHGSAQKIVTKKQVENFEIPLPPLKIQKRIVTRIEELFEKIDEAKELREKAREQTITIFSSALTQIFTQQGKKWQSDKIRNLIENIQTGTTPPSKEEKYFNGDVQWFTPGDLGENQLLKTSSRTITKKAIEEGKARVFTKGTLLFVGIGATLGKVGIASDEVSANQQITGLYFKKLIVPEFAYYWFLYNYDYIRSISPSATLPILNQEGLKDLTINFPPLPQQKKIVVYLNNLREKVEKLKQIQQRQLEELIELNQSISDKAFKGELAK